MALHSMKGGNSIKKHIINEKIRAKEVRLIDDEGKQLGVVSLAEAREMAESKGLDLLLVSKDVEPPICKLINYGQFLYQQKKKSKQNKAGKSANVIKEIKLSHKISIHDYNVRVNAAKKFLGKKNKVKLTIFFRGREITYRDNLGVQTAERFLEDILDYGSKDNDIVKSGRNLTVLINPK
jgi:translation initiation factor IF-3